MAVRTRSEFSCTDCGAQHNKWVGQCPACGSWNTLVEVMATASHKADPRRPRFVDHIDNRGPQPLADVAVEKLRRSHTGVEEFDRVLGGGLVTGSVILIGGDPGIGKSTLVLQCLAHMSRQARTLYITGEESAQQVALRAQRIGVNADGVQLFAHNQVEQVLVSANQLKPSIMVVDSIQTLYTQFLQSAPGSVAQVRECAAQLVRYAKQTGTIVLLIGHVTKDGHLAGPRVLEHMVDTVLYFEGDADSRFRIIRAIKNRFGAVNEIGVFAMTETGLREVGNPSALFLTHHQKAVSGSTILATQEGTRPLLVEIQALVDSTSLGNPRRLTVGLEGSRLAMLLAVLHRHGGVALNDQDVFVNAVGGVRVSEPAADLAILAAVVSSLRDQPIAEGLVIFGEVGLAGEVRPVQRGQDRLREAAKLGFKRAVIPAANAPKRVIGGIEVVAVERLEQALERVFP
ncbi:MAG TPA: DNA repair protein RadA [Acidiferrobacteraceae bacterium]|nr:DNA repair protein RadA [Acidiferrobacteraceae bacterium]